MDDKITIIEGPTPIFEPLHEMPETSMQNWTSGLNQGPLIYDSARTVLRTFKASDLVERCHKAWQQNSTMYLEYRDRIGLTRQTLIMAAQPLITEEGDMLVLWVRNDDEEEEDFHEDDDEDEDSYNFLFGDDAGDPDDDDEDDGDDYGDDDDIGTDFMDLN